MDSWNLIGWVLIGIVALCVTMSVGSFLVHAGARLYLHVRDRNTPPAVGQRWITAERPWPQPYEITDVYENGRIGYRRRSTYAVHSGSWSPEDFKNVIRNTGAWLDR